MNGNQDVLLACDGGETEGPMEVAGGEGGVMVSLTTYI